MWLEVEVILLIVVICVQRQTTTTDESTATTNYATTPDNTAQTIPDNSTTSTTVPSTTVPPVSNANHESRLLATMMRRMNQENLSEALTMTRPLWKSQKDDQIQVTMCLQLKTVVSYNDENGYVSLLFKQRLEWLNVHLSWKPEEFGGVKTIRFPSSRVWIPDVVILGGESTHKPLSARDEEQHNVLIRYNGSTEFTELVVFKQACGLHNTWNFPYDSVNCAIKLGSVVYNETYLHLRHSGKVNLTDYYESTEWTLLDLNVTEIKDSQPPNDYITYTETYSAINVSFVLERRLHLAAMFTMYPAILVMLFSIFIFCLPLYPTARINLSVGIFAVFIILHTLLMTNVPTTLDFKLGYYFVSGLASITAATIVSTLLGIMFNWDTEMDCNLRKPFVYRLGSYLGIYEYYESLMREAQFTDPDDAHYWKYYSEKDGEIQERQYDILLKKLARIEDEEEEEKKPDQEKTDEELKLKKEEILLLKMEILSQIGQEKMEEELKHKKDKEKLQIKPWRLSKISQEFNTSEEDSPQLLQEKERAVQEEQNVRPMNEKSKSLQQLEKMIFEDNVGYYSALVERFSTQQVDDKMLAPPLEEETFLEDKEEQMEEREHQGTSDINQEPEVDEDSRKQNLAVGINSEKNDKVENVKSKPTINVLYVNENYDELDSLEYLIHRVQSPSNLSLAMSPDGKQASRQTIEDEIHMLLIENSKSHYVDEEKEGNRERSSEVKHAKMNHNAHSNVNTNARDDTYKERESSIENKRVSTDETTIRGQGRKDSDYTNPNAGLYTRFRAASTSSARSGTMEPKNWSGRSKSLDPMDMSFDAETARARIHNAAVAMKRNSMKMMQDSSKAKRSSSLPTKDSGVPSSSSDRSSSMAAETFEACLIGDKDCGARNKKMLVAQFARPLCDKPYTKDGVCEYHPIPGPAHSASASATAPATAPAAQDAARRNSLKLIKEESDYLKHLVSGRQFKKLDDEERKKMVAQRDWRTAATILDRIAALCYAFTVLICIVTLFPFNA